MPELYGHVQRVALSLFAPTALVLPWSVHLSRLCLIYFRETLNKISPRSVTGFYMLIRVFFFLLNVFIRTAFHVPVDIWLKTVNLISFPEEIFH